MEPSDPGRSSTLAIWTVSLWAIAFASTALLYWRGTEGYSLPSFLLYGGSTLALLMASIASTSVLRQRWGDAEPAGVLDRTLKRLTTRRWLAWDIAFGVLLPPTLLLIDPWVFRSIAGGRTLLGEYREAAYLFIPQSSLLLAVWMAARPRRLGLWFAGALSAGAVGALAIGLALLPVSALMILILGGGLLGFIPLVTAATFIRRARRAWRLGRRGRTRSVALLQTAGGAILAAAPAAILQLLAADAPHNLQHALR